MVWVQLIVSRLRFPENAIAQLFSQSAHPTRHFVCNEPTMCRVVGCPILCERLFTTKVVVVGQNMTGRMKFPFQYVWYHWKERWLC